MKPYEILAAIGAGGKGEVRWARDAWLKRDVGLNVLPDSSDQDRMARFRARDGGAPYTESADYRSFLRDRRPVPCSEFSEFSSRGERVRLNGKNFPKQMRQVSKLKGFPNEVLNF